MAADDSAERDFSVSGQSGVVPFQAHPERRFVFPDRMPPRRLFVSGFGAGDCALLLAAAPLFVPAAYVRFLLAGCLAALVWWLCFRPRRRRTIPLAGFLALVLIGHSFGKFFGLW